MGNEREEPPFLLDGARVVSFAAVERTPSMPRHASVVAGGTPVDLDAVSRIVIAQSLADDTVYVLLCNERWETFAAEVHVDPQGARAACDAIFRGLSLRWQDYRELSAAEKSEIETTRAFFREMASDPILRDEK